MQVTLICVVNAEPATHGRRIKRVHTRICETLPGSEQAKCWANPPPSEQPVKIILIVSLSAGDLSAKISTNSFTIFWVTRVYWSLRKGINHLRLEIQSLILFFIPRNDTTTIEGASASHTSTCNSCFLAFFLSAMLGNSLHCFHFAQLRSSGLSDGARGSFCRSFRMSGHR